MIYITGDIHQKFDTWKFDGVDFKSEDFLIICGDFGWVWAHSSLKKQVLDEKKRLRAFIQKLKCTVLFCDGNHENFARLNNYKEFPVTKRWGGKVQKLCNKCYHLVRGESFLIDGKKFLALGGAESHDKFLRTPNLSWWEQETIEDIEVENAIKNSDNVDCVITHCCPTSLLTDLYAARYIDSVQPTISTKQLEKLYKHLCTKNHKFKWFFGHYHFSQEFTKGAGDFYLLYDAIYCLDTDSYL